MKTASLLAWVALSAAPLMGQSAKEVADNLSLPPLAPGARQLPMPEAPRGFTVELGGADFEHIISKDGAVSTVLSDTPVLVYFRVTKGKETADSKDYEVVVKPETPAEAGANAKPDTIPAILQWRGGQGEWKPGKEIRVSGVDEARSKNFIRELRYVLPGIKARYVSSKKEADIFLDVQKEGRTTGHPEGYRMEVTPQGVMLYGDTPIGLHWGTRTLLQILASKGAVPCGTAEDFPRYKVRGCMMEVARTPYTISDLRHLVDLMSWYKMNDLHIGINNNYIFHEFYIDAGRDPLKESYAAFRLESKVRGADGTRLTAKDIYYTKKDFRALIDYAKERGVNIVPELNTPAHALSFTRVRPNLIYQGAIQRHPKRRCEMLDAGNPETLKFVSRVFDEYLLKDAKLGCPVFDGCVVHVGSDEFFGDGEDYRKYTNGLLNHVIKRGYTPRLWGSLSAMKGKTSVISKGVQMNLWSADWMSAREAISLGYDVINTHDRALYIVPFADYYRMDWKFKATYENWIPNRIGQVELPAGHPQLMGASFGVWNDMTDLFHRGYGMLDIWNSLSGAVDVLCGKLWGGQKNPMSFEQHCRLVKDIGQGAVMAELKKGTDWSAAAPLKLPAALNHVPLCPPYRLTMEGVKLAKATHGKEQALLSGPEGVLLGVMKDGSIGFRRADGMEFSWDAKLPVGKEVKLELIAELGKTRLLLDGQEVEKMTLNNFRNKDENFQKRTRDLISTFILPGKTLGAAEGGSSPFRGSVRSVDVRR